MDNDPVYGLGAIMHTNTPNILIHRTSVCLQTATELFG